MKTKLLVASAFLACTAWAGDKLRVVATTPFIGDVVRHVARDRVDLRVLLPPGVDPHAFEPTPRDAISLADADVIFINGAGLEDNYIPNLIVRSRTQAPVLDLSESCGVLRVEGGERDPHLWMDPENVKVWAAEVADALEAMDAAHSNEYTDAAASYQRALQEVDNWADREMEGVSYDNRKLVTDHDSFGYFADRFHLTVIGAVIPGFSSGSEPSAQDLARLEDLIESHHVKAIFVGRAINPSLSERVAHDKGVSMVTLDTCTIPEGGDYASFFSNLVVKIAGALK